MTDTLQELHDRIEIVKRELGDLQHMLDKHRAEGCVRTTGPAKRTLKNAKPIKATGRTKPSLTNYQP